MIIIQKRFCSRKTLGAHDDGALLLDSDNKTEPLRFSSRRSTQDTWGDTGRLLPSRIARTGQQTTSQTQPHSNSRTWWTHLFGLLKTGTYPKLFCAVVLHVSVGALLDPRWFAEDFNLKSAFRGLLSNWTNWRTLRFQHSGKIPWAGREWQDVSTQIIKCATCNVAR